MSCACGSEPFAALSAATICEPEGTEQASALQLCLFVMTHRHEHVSWVPGPCWRLLLPYLVRPAPEPLSCFLRVTPEPLCEQLCKPSRTAQPQDEGSGHNRSCVSPPPERVCACIHQLNHASAMETSQSVVVPSTHGDSSSCIASRSHGCYRTCFTSALVCITTPIRSRVHGCCGHGVAPERQCPGKDSASRCRHHCENLHAETSPARQSADAQWQPAGILF